MAVKSFTQQCPSCEAMVPIKDRGLIGKKIDCPKCKYRFVVEDQAEEEPETRSDPKTARNGKKPGPAAKPGPAPANGKKPGPAAKTAPGKKPVAGKPRPEE